MNLKRFGRSVRTSLLMATALLLMGSRSVTAAEVAAPPDVKPIPESIADLQRLEKRVKELTAKIIPATVGVSVGASQGSGVIINEEGFVLTAAHVIGGAGRRVVLTLPDGKRLRGTSLGLNRGLDAGMIKIDDKDATFPHASIGEWKDLDTGDWVIALGHPGGFQKDRPPVLRLGRVLMKLDSVLQTDCTLVGGDSGGPLFDLNGKVIGIHSRIGRSTNWNFHVPIVAFNQDWDRLAKAEDWNKDDDKERGFLGVNGEDHPNGARLTLVGEGLPAEKAGLKVDDIITRVDGKRIAGFRELADNIGKKKPGDEVTLEYLREGEKQTTKVKLVSR